LLSEKIKNEPFPSHTKQNLSTGYIQLSADQKEPIFLLGICNPRHRN